MGRSRMPDMAPTPDATRHTAIQVGVPLKNSLTTKTIQVVDREHTVIQR